MKLKTLYQPHLLRIRKGKQPGMSRSFLVMRITAVLLLVTCLQVSAGGFAQRINISEKNATLEKIFLQIKKQSDYVFWYESKLLENAKKVDVFVRNATVQEVLSVCFKDQPLTYSIVGNTVVIRSSNNVKQVVNEIPVPPAVIKGKVTNEKGEPLSDVSINLKGTSYGTISDADGNFSFTIPDNTGTLVFSFVGYATQEVKLGSTTTINISLLPDNEALTGVVVVGYGTQKKANLTGAVDQVTAEVFENRSLPNLSQGLQGVMPNLNIKLGDGKPTQAPSFNVRGTTSIGQGGSALVLIDGVEGDPSMLNPNDVASISVLKDASSAAIYGARGAFGVVLITTKNPQKDKTSITYTMNHSIKSPTTVPDFVTDGYVFAKWFNEGWSAWNNYSQTPQNVNKTVRFSQEYLAELERRSKDPSLPKVEVNDNGEYVYYDNTDWYDHLYKKNLNATDHNLSFSGSSGKATFLVTGRYFSQEGLFRYNSDDYKMYNLRAKGSIQLYPWLRIDNMTDFSSMNYHNPLNVGEGGSIWRNISDEGHNMSPMFNPDGTLTYSAAYTVGDFWYGRNGIDFNRRVMRNTTGFTANVFDNRVRLKGDFTIQNTDNNDKQIRVPVPYSRIPGVIEYVGNNTNDLQESYRTTEYIATNIYGEYETRSGNDHYFKGMAGFNYEQSTWKRLQTLRNGLIYEDAEDINLALGQSIVTGGGWDRWNIMGGFFRMNYAFKDRYLVEVNGRYDGSSKFPSDERYAFFPSISAGWRVSGEEFFNVPFISDLKIRGSYGSLGNGNISSYAFQEQFSISQSGRILNGQRPQRTSQPGVIPAGLTWETSTTSNIGIDLGMFNNRFRLVGDAYVRKTTDMFTVGMTLPAVFGTNVPYGNYADLKTKGWELILSWRDKTNLASRPLGYELRFTLSDYQSEILKYNNPEGKLSDYYAGQKVGEIWGYVTEGFFTSEEDVAKSAKQTLFRASASGQWLPGDIKFRDLNKDGEINNGDNNLNNPGDMTIIGNTTPRYTYGFNISLDWNNFFFSTFFQGVGKQDWWPGREAGTFWGQYNRPYNRLPTWHLAEIWSEENPDSYLPRYRGYVAQNAAGELSQIQTKYMQSTAYFRMKNIQIGYALPLNIVSRIGASQARVYLSGENLLTWSPLYRITRDLDVENLDGSDRVLTSGTSGNGHNYPMLKSVTFGISITL